MEGSCDIKGQACRARKPAQPKKPVFARSFANLHGPDPNLLPHATALILTTVMTALQTPQSRAGTDVASVACFVRCLSLALLPRQVGTDEKIKVSVNPHPLFFSLFLSFSLSLSHTPPSPSSPQSLSTVVGSLAVHSPASTAKATTFSCRLEAAPYKTCHHDDFIT